MFYFKYVFFLYFCNGQWPFQGDIYIAPEVQYVFLHWHSVEYDRILQRKPLKYLRLKNKNSLNILLKRSLIRCPGFVVFVVSYENTDRHLHCPADTEGVIIK